MKPEAKPWWRSWTLWTNVVALAGIVVARFVPEMSVEGREEIEVAVLAILNIALRLKTSQPIQKPKVRP